MSGLLKVIPPLAAVAILSLAALAEPLPPDATYRPLPTQPLDVVKAIDEADKPQVMRRQASARAALRSVRPADARRDDVGRAQAGSGWRAGPACPRNHMGRAGSHERRATFARKVCCRMASCRCRTSSSRPAGKCSRTRRSSRSGARRAATCGASMSIWTCRSISGRSFRRRSSSPAIRSSATSPAGSCSRSGTSTSLRWG